MANYYNQKDFDATIPCKHDGTWCRFIVVTCGHHIDDALGQRFTTVENWALPDIGKGKTQTGRDDLNAHHVIPWEFLDHGVFNVLRDKRPISGLTSILRDPNIGGPLVLETIREREAKKIVNPWVAERLDAQWAMEAMSRGFEM